MNKNIDLMSQIPYDDTSETKEYINAPLDSTHDSDVKSEETNIELAKTLYSKAKEEVEQTALPHILIQKIEVLKSLVQRYLEIRDEAATNPFNNEIAFLNKAAEIDSYYKQFILALTEVKSDVKLMHLDIKNLF